MSEQNKVIKETENNKPEENKEAKGTVKEKPGFFTRAKNWVKAHKQGLIGFGIGAGVGVGGSIAAAEVGKRIGNRRQCYDVTPDEPVSPLDPNV